MRQDFSFKTRNVIMFLYTCTQIKSHEEFLLKEKSERIYNLFEHPLERGENVKTLLHPIVARVV